MAQFGVKFVWRNKFRPTKRGVVGPNLFGQLQTEPLPKMLGEYQKMRTGPRVTGFN